MLIHYVIKSFYVTDGNTGGDFDIDVNNGSLLLVNTLDGDRTLQYVLEIEASDTMNTAYFNLTVDVKTGMHAYSPFPFPYTFIRQLQ